MVFGIFIDVPLLAGTFALMFYYRRQLTNTVSSIHLPIFALYVLLSIPLLIFEEQIDCMPSWCGTVIIPPTIPFLLVEIAILGALVLKLHPKSLFRVTLVYSIFGLAFELLLGGLVGAPFIVDILIGPYVMLGYAYVSMLPLRVLMKGRLLQSHLGTNPPSSGSTPQSPPGDDPLSGARSMIASMGMASGTRIRS